LCSCRYPSATFLEDSVVGCCYFIKYAYEVGIYRYAFICDQCLGVTFMLQVVELKLSQEELAEIGKLDRNKHYIRCDGWNVL
uniref:Uncharacterized protein n=1 Tax=Parascaris equorum TaxID=6256 RepID=A0A914RA67_PAREQ